MAQLTVINFSHPLTAEQVLQLEALTSQPVGSVRDVPTKFDPEQPFVGQVITLLEQVGLTPTEWQTLPILINPPALNVITATLLAELHGRMGYFPAILRLRPLTGSIPPRFEVAEIINLQAVRESARSQR